MKPLRVTLWSLFAALSVATYFVWRSRLVREYLEWEFGSLLRLVTVMGLICLALSIHLIRTEQRKVLPIAIVGLGLLVGQSWFLQMAWFWFTWPVLGGGP